MRASGLVGAEVSIITLEAWGDLGKARKRARRRGVRCVEVGEGGGWRVK